MGKEIWRDIPNYEGKYQVSDLGRIKSLKRCIIMIPELNANGRLYITLFKNNQGKGFMIHRLVMAAFRGASNLDVDHKNHNPLDNRLKNLRYCTRLENHTIYKKVRAKSGIRNVTYNSERNKYYFKISILDKDYYAPYRKTIKEAAIDFYIMKEAFHEFPDYFRNHQIESLYPLNFN